MEEYEEEEMGRSSSRAEVALALAEEDESGLGSSKREGMLIFVWRMEGEIVHRHGSGPSRGVNKGQSGSFLTIWPVSVLGCLLVGLCTRSERQGAA